MVGGIILVYFTVIVVIGNQAVAYDTHRIQVDDLAGVASKQSDRWQKSKASDHQQSDFIDNVDSGKKGYNIKRGCIYLLIIHQAIRWRLLLLVRVHLIP